MSRPTPRHASEDMDRPLDHARDHSMDHPGPTTGSDLPTRVRRWFDAAVDSGDAHAFLREHQRDDPPAIARARELIDVGEAHPLDPLLDALALVDQRESEAGPPRLLEDGQAIGTPAGPGVVEALLSADDQRRFAEVYRLRLDAGGRCAIKVLRESVASAEARRRFRAEASALARLEHPGIARLLAAGHVHTEAGERLAAIAMELVDGRPLDDWARGRPAAEIARAIAFIARAAHYAHLRGVLHRDIKPANILVDHADRPILLDLGVARLLNLDDPDNPQATMTTAGGIVGTPHFMAPEQLTPATRPVDLRCDVYALGLVLYELLTGEPMVAIAGLSQAEALERKLNARPAIPRGLSVRDQLVTAAICAASPEPDHRHASAESLAEDIDRALEGRPLLVRPPGRARRALLFARRNWVPMSASTMVAAALLVAGVVYVMSQREVALARDRAEARFDETREFARWVIFDLADDLTLLPGTTALRSELVGHASDTLDRLSADPIADDGLLLELAEAYTRLSEIQNFEVGDASGSFDPLARTAALLDRLDDPSAPLALMLGAYLDYRWLVDLRSDHPQGPRDRGPRAHQPLLDRMTRMQDALLGDGRYWRWRSNMHFMYARSLKRDGADDATVLGAQERAIADAQRAVDLAPDDPLAQEELVRAWFFRAYALGESEIHDAEQFARGVEDALAYAQRLDEAGHPRGGNFVSWNTQLMADARARLGDWEGFLHWGERTIAAADRSVALLPQNLMVVRNAEVARMRLAMVASNANGRSPGAPPEAVRAALPWARQAREMYAQRERRGWTNEVEEASYAKQYDAVIAALEGMR